MMREQINKMMREWERMHPGERMSIRRLATLAKISPQTIQRLMRGEAINDASKEAIAKVLKCDIGDLISSKQP